MCAGQLAERRLRAWVTRGLGECSGAVSVTGVELYRWRLHGGLQATLAVEGVCASCIGLLFEVVNAECDRQLARVVAQVGGGVMRWCAPSGGGPNAAKPARAA